MLVILNPEPHTNLGAYGQKLMTLEHFDHFWGSPFDFLRDLGMRQFVGENILSLPFEFPQEKK